jgi:hypothetical protein
MDVPKHQVTQADGELDGPADGSDEGLEEGALLKLGLLEGEGGNDEGCAEMLGCFFLLRL